MYGRERPPAVPIRERWDGKVEDQLAGSNLSTVQREAFAGLAAANGAYDTEAALEQLAQRLGIESTAPYVNNDRRDVLVARERDIETRLARIANLETSRDTLPRQTNSVGTRTTRNRICAQCSSL